MARLVLYVLALLVAGGLADPIKKSTPKIGDSTFVRRQYDLMNLYFRLHEPIVEESRKVISSWSLEKNIEQFSNVTAVRTYIELLEHRWVLPRAVPFNVHLSWHRFEAKTLFNVLFSAKEYDTFYKAAVYFRERVNEYLFSYILTAVIYQRKDTQGIFVPHIYEVFPSFFNNAEVMTTVQRINTHGFRNLEYYPSTYKWENNVVVRRNSTVWPYSEYQHDVGRIAYFTHDYGLNSLYYNLHITEPSWLGGEVVPLGKDRRGEWFWFVHRQLLARYYMERLSSDLAEVPEIEEVVKEGYSSGLLYTNGIPFPVRPNHFHLNQPDHMDDMQAIHDFERRIRDDIDRGYYINDIGERVSLRVPESIEDLARLIEANVDSPNVHYYRDFISLWKKVLGNALVHENYDLYYNNNVPTMVPSVLEHYQTALRDPAFYMIWKRVLSLFERWQEKLPRYKREQLALPQVDIKKVDVDKLVTYFEYTYMNVSSYLHTREEETNRVNVLVQHPRLNHKKFQTRVKVMSEVKKSVVVRFFLAPKYDSHGHEIPLHINTQNFFLIDEFIYDLPAGESVIVRDSTDNRNFGKDWSTTHQVYENVRRSLNDNGQYIIDQIEDLIKIPGRMMLPKGRVGGMPFVFMVYISEYRAPKIPYGTGFDPSTSFGFDTRARYITDEPLAFPLDRPLYPWQLIGVKNMAFENVAIYHKHSPEVVVYHVE